MFRRPPTPPPQTLPEDRNVDGRPIWEPPTFNYSMLIGDEYEKQREAVLKYTDNNVVRTTEILDARADADLMTTYLRWVVDNRDEAINPECERFFANLRQELFVTWFEDQNVAEDLDVFLWRNEDETWTAINHRQWEKRAYPFMKRGHDDDDVSHSTGANPARVPASSAPSDGPQRVIIVGGEAYLYKPEADDSSDFARKKFEAQHKFMRIDAEASSPQKLPLNAQPSECQSGPPSHSNGAQQIIYTGGEAYLYLPEQGADNSPGSDIEPAPALEPASADGVARGHASLGLNRQAFNSNSGFKVGTPLALRIMRAVADKSHGCSVKAATDDDVD